MITDTFVVLLIAATSVVLLITDTYVVLESMILVWYC